MQRSLRTDNSQGEDRAMTCPLCGSILVRFDQQVRCGRCHLAMCDGCDGVASDMPEPFGEGFEN